MSVRVFTVYVSVCGSDSFIFMLMKLTLKPIHPPIPPPTHPPIPPPTYPPISSDSARDSGIKLLKLNLVTSKSPLSVCRRRLFIMIQSLSFSRLNPGRGPQRLSKRPWGATASQRFCGRCVGGAMWRTDGLERVPP